MVLITCSEITEIYLNIWVNASKPSIRLSQSFCDSTHLRWAIRKVEQQYSLNPEEVYSIIQYLLYEHTGKRSKMPVNWTIMLLQHHCSHVLFPYCFSWQSPKHGKVLVPSLELWNTLKSIHKPFNQFLITLQWCWGRQWLIIRCQFRSHYIPVFVPPLMAN
jgi:hypothetical protein